MSAAKEAVDKAAHRNVEATQVGLPRLTSIWGIDTTVSPGVTKVNGRTSIPNTLNELWNGVLGA